jgi:DNA-directed RNA polymerase subunit RPC12/RpoP
MVKTVKCPICSEPYKVYAFMAGDQSACPYCRHKAEQKEGKYENWRSDDRFIKYPDSKKKDDIIL